VATAQGREAEGLWVGVGASTAGLKPQPGMKLAFKAVQGTHEGWSQLSKLISSSSKLLQRRLAFKPSFCEGLPCSDNASLT
jgi:hypothetical protein